MRTVLVCSAGFGEGHHSAARSLCVAIDELGAAHGVRSEFVDTLATRHPRLNRLLTGSYVAVLNRAPWLWAVAYRRAERSRGVGVPPLLFGTLRAALRETLERTRPAAVISTYPAYGYVLEEIARSGGPRGFLRATVVTDSISVNAVWLRAPTDFYFVANPQTAAVLQSRGVPEAKIQELGFPVHPRFATECERVTLPDPADPRPGQGRRVFFMMNAHRKDAAELVHRLLTEIDGIALTVTAGRDPQRHAAIEAAVASVGERGAGTRVLGWTKEIPELLAAHHLIISKAGGATVQEAIAAGCPMLVSQVSPGQEEGNAQLVLDSEAGMLALTPDAIVAAVRAAFADNAALCRRWRTNITRLSRPNAARAIAQFVLAKL